MLKFWAEDEDGFEVDGSARTFEWGWDLVDPKGNSPAMEDVSAARLDFSLPAQEVTQRKGAFKVPSGTKAVSLNAVLTYVHIVPPPGEAQDRIQKSIIRRIELAKTQAEKDRIVNVEVPARMNAMNVLFTTYPDIQISRISERFVLK